MRKKHAQNEFEKWIEICKLMQERHEKWMNEKENEDMN